MAVDMYRCLSPDGSFATVVDMEVKRIFWGALGLAMLLSVGCVGTDKYGAKLERGAAYDPEATSAIASYIDFTYQEANHPDLVALRESLSFDEYLASKAHLSETELILDLIGYVHALVPWDGSAPWPEGSLNTLGILAHARDAQQGVNCRMKAIILQELYLAAGIPARMVSCIPLDANDSDSHVIVAAWSNEKGRWIWADPSFNAHVMNGEGKLVGIEEVRNGLVEGRQFHLNPEAVVREEPLTESFYFDYYMKKNLYAFITPMEAAFDYEGSPGDRYSVMLVPAIELPANEEQLVKHHRFRESSYTRYVLSDPQLFWKPPERI
jgi:hypothetical protein